MFNVLPAIVQNRLPAIPSIRRTLVRYRGSVATGQSAAEFTNASVPETPPPDYTSRPSSVGNDSSSDRSSVLSIDGDTLFQAYTSVSRSSISTPPSFPASGTDTGINWKYAHQGVSQVSQAYAESHALVRKGDRTSTILTRQLYIYGMTYLLRGLPSDLTPEETLSLQAAVPHSLAVNQGTHGLVPFTKESSAPQRPPPNTSILHRIIAILVFQLFIMIEFLLPYLKLFLGNAYRYEKEHRVAQRIADNSIRTADALRRGSLQLSHSICQMNDGKIGQALNDATLWWIRGLTGGLQQGVTDGVLRINGDKRREKEKFGKAR